MPYLSVPNFSSPTFPVIRLLVGLFMILAGVMHFVAPKAYGAFLPAWTPWKHGLVFWSGVAEILVGAALLYPPTGRWGALGLLLLMVAFLPLHAYHLYEPPTRLALPYWGFVVRAVLQVLIVYGCWRLYRM